MKQHCRAAFDLELVLELGLVLGLVLGLAVRRNTAPAQPFAPATNFKYSAHV